MVATKIQKNKEISGTIWYNKENTKTNWQNMTNMNITEWDQKSLRKQPKKHTKSDQKILKKTPDIKKDPKKVFQLLKFRKAVRKQFLHQLESHQHIPTTPTMQRLHSYVM